jgi:hypothetical protein
MYAHCTHTSVHVHNCTLFPTIPNQPCDAGESLLRAGAAPSELPPSWHQSFQLTDHPGAACHIQIATATGSPHTNCCHACHPLLQSHRFPQESQTSGPVVLAVLVRNGRGSVTSQEQGDQWNSSNHIGCWCNIQARGSSWRGLIQLGHPSTLHRPADGKFQLLKCAEQDQVVTAVIRPVSVVCILRGSPSRLTQVAGKEKLRTSVPSVCLKQRCIEQRKGDSPAASVGAMVDLHAWFVVQNCKNGSCDPDGGSNYRSGKFIGTGDAVPSCKKQTYSIGFNTVVRNAYCCSKCQEGSRSVHCDSLPVHCIDLIVWLPQTGD